MSTRIYRESGGWVYVARYKGLERSSWVASRQAAVFGRALAVAEVYGQVCREAGA